MSIKDRFSALKTFADSYTRELESTIRRRTGIGNFRCFPCDEFISAYPEDHLTRAGAVLISLRLTLDLKGFGEDSVNQLKIHLTPLADSLDLLRPNFSESKEEIDFDWHITEVEQKLDEGQTFANRVTLDCEKLGHAIKQMAKAEKPAPS
ncbi:MAG: hypothetical protein V4655_13930 [Bdellovibrionota bacterium]